MKAGARRTGRYAVEQLTKGKGKEEKSSAEEGRRKESKVLRVVRGRLRSDAAAGRAETLEDRIVPTETKGSGSWPDDYSPFSEGEQREKG